VFSAEYLGSTQIVSVTTAHGLVRARLAANMKVEVGDNVGLSFVPDMLSVFDAATGRALRSALHEPTHAMEAAYG
jgi:multiple sugar transport system ATP-binding protein